MTLCHTDSCQETTRHESHRRSTLVHRADVDSFFMDKSEVIEGQPGSSEVKLSSASQLLPNQAFLEGWVYRDMRYTLDRGNPLQVPCGVEGLN